MRLLSVGECMVELSAATDDLWSMGYAGDTLNTAWYAQALRPAGWDVSYLTVLGQDALSDRIAAFIASAGIGTDLIRRHPTRSPGLYMIELKAGERSFTYWRDSSAARTLADDPAALGGAFATADAIYFSGITLAILGPEGRDAFLHGIARARGEGRRILFDTNLRPRLWSSENEMRDTTEAAARLADLILPSYEDEAAIFGDASPAATADRYARLGVAEVVVKNGGGRMCCRLDGVDQPLPDLPTVRPVDTTGAGDSFNGAYIMMRLGGAHPAEAVAQAHRIAGAVVGHRGALLPASAITAVAVGDE